jgi:predicted metal-binding membrane protein
MAGGQAVDRPRLAYSVLERRATLTTVAVLLALATAAWAWTARNSSDMVGMAQGLGSVGSAMPFDMSAAVFMSMWTTMMVAMMFPTVAPIVLLHRMVLRRRGEGLTSSAAFAGGYLLVWAAVGLIPLGLLLGFRGASNESGWVGPVSGAVLVAAGAYQFTRWKDTCQRACRSPLTFLATHDFGQGARGAVRTGMSHGLYCLGCCWALMSVLFVVGLMNLVWMAGIAVVFLAEKNWRYGSALSKVAGVAVICFGILVFVHPSVLPSGSAAPSSM